MSGIQDEQDLDRLKECVDSPGYKLITERLQELLEQQRCRLEAPELTDGMMRRGQGVIYAFRALLNLPQIMIDEYDSIHKGTR